MTKIDLKHRQLKRLAEQGRAQLVGTQTDAIISFPIFAPFVNPGQGQCAIIYKMLASGFTTGETSPGAGEATWAHGYNVYDQYDNVIGSGRFVAFDRVNSVQGGSTPDWRSAVPCKPIEFYPADPIVVPPGCRIAPSAASAIAFNDMGGTNWVARGYILSVGDARALGFDVPDYHVGDASPNVLNIRTSTVGAILTSSAVEILAGRAGKHIQITHIHIRQQQQAHSPTITGTIRQSDDTVIFKFCNNNPSDFAEWSFSPEDMYLDQGEGIEVLGDAGINASVTISYTFVDHADVPGDAWWSYLSPGLPSPGGGTLGLLSLYTTRGATFQLHYPARETTGTTPGKGKQHIVNGYAMSIQKDSTNPSDHLYLALTTGDAEGSVGVATATSGIPQTNNLISPIIGATSHDQCIFLAEDDLDVACGPDTGLVLLDMTATGVVITPQAADLDVDEIHCLVWGRTVPTRVRGDSHFKGGNIG